MTNTADENHDQELDKALLDFLNRLDAGIAEDREVFFKRYPSLRSRLTDLLDTADWIEKMAGPKLLGDGAPNNPASDSKIDIEPSPNVDPNGVTLAAPNKGDEIAHFSFTGNSDGRNGTRSEPARSSDESTLPHPLRNAAGLPSLDNTQATLPCRFGDYILEKVLGRGGMGVVYLATQTSLNRQVAVKMIRSGALASDDEVSRFYAEARSAGSLMHPSIITIYHCGELEGHHYFSMDYVPGTDLAKKLADGPMNVREAVRYVRDVALAIDYAHSQGVVHRDLKPANVLITPEEEVVLTDFGLAKRMGAEDGLTATGAALGTPSYMSPEQAAGKSEEQDALTDVYAMGAILYALLAGRPPFQGESVLQTIMAVMSRPAINIRTLRSDVHPDLETIVHKCLEKQPSRRYSSAKALAEDLDRFYEGAPITARPPSTLRKLKYWVLNVPIVAALSGNKNVEPTASQRLAQNLFIATAFLSILVWLVGPSLLTSVRNNTLPRQITIASGTPGGMYFKFAGLLSTELEKETGLHPNIIPTNGSLENFDQLQNHKAQLAIMQESAIRSDRVAVIAPLFYEAVHILARKNLNIQTLADIRGKRVMLGAKSSGSRQAAIRLLSHFNIQVEDVDVIEGDWVQKELIPDVDAAIVVVKAGQSGIRDLLHQEGFELLPIENAAELALEEPMFRPYSISLEEYGLGKISESSVASQDSPPKSGSVQTLATTALLVARRDTPDLLVTQTLEAIYPGGTPASSISGLIPIELAANWQGLPYHQAARRFFAKYEK